MLQLNVLSFIGRGKYESYSDENITGYGSHK